MTVPQPELQDARRAGGVAALVAAATFVVGFALFVSVLADYTTGGQRPADSVDFLVDHQLTFHVWNLVIYLVFGVALVVLVLVLHGELRATHALRTSVATALGLVWVGLVLAAGMVANVGLAAIVDLNEDDPGQAASLWSALDAVQNGLGGGNELVGGLWVVLVSWTAIRARVFPAALGYLGVVTGAAGTLTVLPGLEAAGAVFGLGLIAWFTWVGLLLVRRPQPTADPLAGGAGEVGDPDLVNP
jgi:hypothetical protein